MHSTLFFNRLFQAILTAGADQEVLERFKAEQDSILSDPSFNQFLSSNPGT